LLPSLQTASTQIGLGSRMYHLLTVQGRGQGVIPRVVLRATHEGALSCCSLADLKRFAVDLA
jgi:uncharacterized protein (DUF2237 family)